MYWKSYKSKNGKRQWQGCKDLASTATWTWGFTLALLKAWEKSVAVCQPYNHNEIVIAADTDPWGWLVLRSWSDHGAVNCTRVLSKIPLRCWIVQLPRDLQRAGKKECFTSLKDCRKDSNHGVIFWGMASIVFLTVIELIIIMVYWCFWRFATFWGVCIPARRSRLRRNPRKRP